MTRSQLPRRAPKSVSRLLGRSTALAKLTQMEQWYRGLTDDQKAAVPTWVRKVIEGDES
jgi:hypothetical protein